MTVSRGDGVETGARSPLSLGLVGLDHLGDDVVEVADDAVVGDGEDRRIEASVLMAMILATLCHARPGAAPSR